jgi:hypothetical protein
MEYDFNYFSGKDLAKPTKPHRPRLASPHNSIEAFKHAEDFQKYEILLDVYSQDISILNRNKSARRSEMIFTLQTDYDINRKQFDLIWDMAESNSDCMQRTIEVFDEYYSLITKFTELELGDL